MLSGRETCKLTTDVQTSTLENYNAISQALRNMTPGVLYSVKVSHEVDEDGIGKAYEWPGNVTNLKLKRRANNGLQQNCEV